MLTVHLLHARHFARCWGHSNRGHRNNCSVSQSSTRSCFNLGGQGRPFKWGWICCLKGKRSESNEEMWSASSKPGEVLNGTCITESVIPLIAGAWQVKGRNKWTEVREVGRVSLCRTDHGEIFRFYSKGNRKSLGDFKQRSESHDDLLCGIIIQLLYENWFREARRAGQGGQSKKSLNK